MEVSVRRGSTVYPLKFHPFYLFQIVTCWLCLFPGRPTQDRVLLCRWIHEDLGPRFSRWKGSSCREQFSGLSSQLMLFFFFCRFKVRTLPFKTTSLRHTQFNRIFPKKLFDGRRGCSFIAPPLVVEDYRIIFFSGPGFSLIAFFVSTSKNWPDLPTSLIFRLPVSPIDDFKHKRFPRPR